MPNEPFDYDRLDALLREFGYEDPETPPDDAPQPPAQPVQQPARPVQPRTQAAARTQPQTIRQQTARQLLQEQFYGHPKYDPSRHPVGRGQRAQPAPQPQVVLQQQAVPQRPAGQPAAVQAPMIPPSAQTAARPAATQAVYPLQPVRSVAPPQAAPRQMPQQQQQFTPPQKPKRRRRRVWKIVLTTLLLALVLAVAAAVILLRSNLTQPKSDDALGARKDGCSSILLAGTDADGMRTDTIILCTIDKKAERISLLSIPRDTLVNDSYPVPKINGTYGVYGSGEDGMEALMDAVQKLVGFRPDGYVLVDLDAFVELVDLMGGVEFDVPVDMLYADPAQDLTIDLDAGLQTLDGEQAMGLVRFRSGYALADLERINVQRDFLSACMEQWVTPGLALKAPDLLPVIMENVTTDLTTVNLVWCAGAILRCDTAGVETNTLPGSAANWNGGSYYIASAYDTVELINAFYNPYAVDVTIYDLDVRTP